MSFRAYMRSESDSLGETVRVSSSLSSDSGRC